jgi:hypothetical protein
MWMTRKHYVKIAEHVKKMLRESSEEEKKVIYKLVEIFILEAQNDNPKFDQVKFRNAIKL